MPTQKNARLIIVVKHQMQKGGFHFKQGNYKYYGCWHIPPWWIQNGGPEPRYVKILHLADFRKKRLSPPPHLFYPSGWALKY